MNTHTLPCMFSDAVIGPRAPMLSCRFWENFSCHHGRPGAYDYTFSFLQGTSLKMDDSGAQCHFSFYNFHKYFYSSRIICHNTKVATSNITMTLFITEVDIFTKSHLVTSLFASVVNMHFGNSELRVRGKGNKNKLLPLPAMTLIILCCSP